MEIWTISTSWNLLWTFPCVAFHNQLIKIFRGKKHSFPHDGCICNNSLLIKALCTRKIDEWLFFVAFFNKNSLRIAFHYVNENKCDEMYFYYIIIALLSSIFPSLEWRLSKVFSFVGPQRGEDNIFKNSID